MKSRKFQLAVGFTLILCCFLTFNVLDQAAFVELAKWTLSGYLGANVAHRAVEAGAESLAKEKKNDPAH